MTAPRLTTLARRAADWLVELPEAPGPGVEELPACGPHCVRARSNGSAAERRHAAVAVVGLARRCGATTVARALGAELATRDGGAAVVAAAEQPAVVALGSSAASARLAEALPCFEQTRPAGRLCLAACDDPAAAAAETRPVAPAVFELEPGTPALEVAPAVDRVVLVASPNLEPALAAAVAETIEAVATSPIVAVNRASDHGPWLVRADVLIPESRFGARFALAGREPRGWLGRSIAQLADLCAPT